MRKSTKKEIELKKSKASIKKDIPKKEPIAPKSNRLRLTDEEVSLILTHRHNPTFEFNIGYKIPKPYLKGKKENILVLGDTHFPFERAGYLEFCRETQERYQAGTVIHIGDECFPGDAQILSEKGWVKLEDYKDGDKVLQYNEDGTSEFVIPSRYIEKEYEGNLIVYSKKGLFSKTTPRHNLVVTGLKKQLIKVTAENACQHYAGVLKTTLNGPGIDLTNNQIKLQVALSADGSFNKKGNAIRISFKKRRKVERFATIMQESGLRYTQSIPPSNPDYESFFIHGNNELSNYFKKFNWDWISQMSLEQRELFMEEIQYWDGYTDKFRDRIVFCTTELENAEFVQTMAHITGRVAYITSKKEKFSTYYRVNIYANRNQSKLGTGSLVPYSGMVYCVTVPSGMILTKQEGKISVSGNCDNHAISYHESDPDGYSAGNEAELAQAKLNIWYKVFPKVSVMVGNHSSLPFRQAMTSGLPKRFIKAYEELWNAPNDWKWHLDMELFGVYFVHGTGAGGDKACINRAMNRRQSVVQGHLHSIASVTYNASHKDCIWGMQVGCGVDDTAYALSYAKTNIKKSIISCGLVLDKGQVPLIIKMNL